MRALVTGGGGFLGRYVAEALAARGDTVRVIGRRRYPEIEAQGIECRQVDLTERAGVVAACEGVDTVFHCGALAGYWGPREVFFATNVEGTRHVLEGCRRHGVAKLVFTSSPSVVFGGEDIEGADESCPYPASYLNPYAETKGLAEQEVLAADGVDGLRTAALRPHLIWGPRDNQIVPRLVARARAGKVARIGDGRNKVSVIYVENAARAHLALADALVPGAPVCGRTYFISQDEPVLLWDFIGRILEGFGLPPIRHSMSLGTASTIGAAMEAAYRVLRISGEPRMTRWLAKELGTSHWFSDAAARRDFGYRAWVDTEEGLRRLFAAGLPEG